MISGVTYPDKCRNYCLFDKDSVDLIVNKKEQAIPQIKQSLEKPVSEDEVLINLYALNCMLDEGVSGIDELYPTLSKYNNTTSPNIQTYLAGIYRKIKVPDAFGPLCAMLIRNAVNPPANQEFDPNEEIGGAILDYLA